MNKMRRIFSLLTLFAVTANGVFLNSLFADGLIPRASLITEYLFNGGSVSDTSGNGNPVANYGATFGYDSTGAINFASFSGTSQIGGVNNWYSDASAGYTLSFWIQTAVANRTNPANIGGPYCPSGSTYGGTQGCLVNYSYVASPVSYDSLAKQIVFTTKRIGGPTSDMGLWLTSDYKCSFEENSNQFDCSFLKDEKWHNVVMRKDDYGTLTVFVDGSSYSVFRSNASSIGKSISLGKGMVYNYVSGSFTANESTKFIGKLAAFRLYRSALADDVIGAFYGEYPFIKPQLNPQTPVISIAQPDTTQSTSKTISATTNTGSLQMSLTRGEVCNTTLNFETYTPLTFSSYGDNGQKICYKATNGSNVSYKLSTAISGVLSESQVVTTDTIYSGTAYKSWGYSGKIKTTDYMYTVIGTIQANGNGVAINFIDMNGDGLVDVISKNPNIVNGNSAGEYRAVLLNNGDMNFRPGYRCYTESSTGLAYGDCADVNYK